MNQTILRHKWIAAVCSIAMPAGIWLTVAMLRPPVSKAFALTEMQSFVFPPVSLSAGQTVQICATNMGDGSVRGLIGLLDVADTTHALMEVPFTFDAHKGTCTLLPAAQIGGSGGAPVAGPNAVRQGAVPFLAFSSSNTWTDQGKVFVASLQITDGTSNTIRAVLTPSFMPAVEIPTSDTVPVP